MVIYFNKSDIETVTTATSARAAIASLNAIINTLLAAAATAAMNTNVKEYSYDDGRIKTRMEYRDLSAITAQINSLLSLQQFYLQVPGMNSRVMRLIDSKNMPNWFCGGGSVGGSVDNSKEAITVGAGYTISNNGTSLTGPFFLNLISEIDTNNQIYIVNVDFSQNGNIVTWVNGNTFNNGQVLIAKI